MAPKTRVSSKRKKEKKNIVEGIVHIQATFNNTLITVTDMTGNVISWASAGVGGFKGSKKSTPFAAQVACEKAMEGAKFHGLQIANVCVKGPGSGRESAIRAVDVSGVRIKSLRDVTPIPHNGCRPRKKRRI